MTPSSTRVPKLQNMYYITYGKVFATILIYIKTVIIPNCIDPCVFLIVAQFVARIFTSSGIPNLFRILFLWTN